MSRADPQRKKRYALSLAISIFVLIAVLIASLCIGKYRISPLQVFSILFGRRFGAVEWTQTMERIVLNSRLPRMIAAVFVGAALSVSGAAYQGIFRNPLVSPDLLGVSHGACVGAALAVLLHLGYYGKIILAFAGGSLAVIVTVTFSRIIRRDSTMTMVLSGVIVGGFFTAVLGLLKYLADPDTELAEIVYWQMGSLAKVKAASLYAILPILFLSGLVIILFRWRINVISLGEKDSQVLGVELRKERGLIILASTLLTAASVCICGTIGWIGLILPHIARMTVGQNNERVIPLVAVLGAAFLALVDLLARNLTGTEIPLSIITGFLGTPFFAFILFKQRTGGK